ncbi:hypothetical protein DFP92_105128 [Yoonia sediminilitoris]|uniref:Uncharacterized protein n=2 Tax=Yoonia sediminilitoris TaxID=1286148 RepID=A0A2T6KHE3_9RHOB|nr:hypothetical protein C8N45_105128 [Yoonia sediminilitoris]RCW95622.1 hypothetical protein DFP92_105128 [Yoonia sediminilitoris]
MTVSRVPTDGRSFGSGSIATISEDRVIRPGTEIGLTCDAGLTRLFPHQDATEIPHRKRLGQLNCWVNWAFSKASSYSLLAVLS